MQPIVGSDKIERHATKGMCQSGNSAVNYVCSMISMAISELRRRSLVYFTGGINSRYSKIHNTSLGALQKCA
jgi:hypothetical protein